MKLSGVRTGRACVAGIAATALLLAGCGSSGSSSASHSGQGSTSSPSGSAPSQSPSATRSSSSAPPLTQAQLSARTTASLQAIAKGQPHHAISVAAVNLGTGQSYSWGATSGMWTASCYKLFVLATLLLHRQDSGGLSDSEADQATTMIENSNNVAGYSLFLDAGGRPGLSAAARTFGMHHTVPGETDPTFTETSAMDYLHLLRALVESNGPLTHSSQRYILGLMRNVEADQRWGVGVLADKGTDFANKNGWLSIENDNGPGENDNGLWAVTSAGVLDVHGHTVLAMVMTEHQPSFGAGVSLVQRLARTMGPTVGA